MLSSPFLSWHPLVILWNLLQLGAILTGYDAEKASSAKYSKFAADLKEGSEKEPLVSSKMGMLIIYTPALLVSTAFSFSLPAFLGDVFPAPSLASWMLLIQFAKRDLEVLFLHKYSGHTLLNLARFIGTYYAATAFAIACVATPEPSERFTTMGMGLFSAGIAGNLYHHYLLATLRQPTNNDTNGMKNRYLAPKGGLFEYVAAPHYMFELIGWLGIAVASHSLTGYLTFMSMSAYLAARASNNNEWNREKFTENEWPASRRNLVPFLF
jgi:hypothetical protein